MTSRNGHATVALAVWLVTSGSPLAAQAVGTLGLGASVIEYDGFLVSGAAVFAPAFRYDAANLSVAGQGGWTRFQSGNQVLQGTVGAAWLSTPRGGRLVELSGSMGASQYANASATAHALIGSRVHFLGRRGGGWLGITSGGSFGLTARLPMEIAAGGWTTWTHGAVVGTVTATWLGGRRYLDLLGVARWSMARYELEARAGARALSRNGADDDIRSGVFAEVAGVIPMSSRLALTLGGGNYLSDPVRDAAAARYASLGLRFSIGGRAEVPMTGVGAAMARAERTSGMNASRVRIEVSALGSSRTLRVQVPEAKSVELMGDFTDWEPVALTRVGAGVWEIRLPLPSGVHRLNVRIDGGPWLVPAGARLEPTEFGGPAGVVVVP